jgi:integrase
MRISEALALRPADIDPERGTVRVMDGKGHKPRTVGLDSGAMATIQRWAGKRRAAGIRGRVLLCPYDEHRLHDTRAEHDRLIRRPGQPPPAGRRAAKVLAGLNSRSMQLEFPHRCPGLEPRCAARTAGLAAGHLSSPTTPWHR